MSQRRCRTHARRHARRRRRIPVRSRQGEPHPRRPRLFDRQRRLRRGRSHDRRADADARRHRRRAAFASERAMDLHPGGHVPAKIGDTEVEAKPGSVVYVPSNAVHFRQGDAGCRRRVLHRQGRLPQPARDQGGLSGGSSAASCLGPGSGDAGGPGRQDPRRDRLFGARAWATIDGSRPTTQWAAARQERVHREDVMKRFGLVWRCWSGLRRGHRLGAGQIPVEAGEDRRALRPGRRDRHHLAAVRRADAPEPRPAVRGREQAGRLRHPRDRGNGALQARRLHADGRQRLDQRHHAGLFQKKFSINFERSVVSVSRLAIYPSFLITTTQEFRRQDVAELVAMPRRIPARCATPAPASAASRISTWRSSPGAPASRCSTFRTRPARPA